MSTIVYRDGMIAADSGITFGHTTLINKHPKIARNKSGDLAGACGRAGFCDTWIKWFESGEKGEMPKPPEQQESGSGGGHAIICRNGGKMEFYDSTGMSYLDMSYFAFGAGDDIATGALWAGATASEAVEAAATHNAYTLLPVVVLKHDS